MAVWGVKNEAEYFTLIAGLKQALALRFEKDLFHDNLHKSDIYIHCPKCKKECTFEWIVFRNGARNLRQSYPVHGYLQFAPVVPAYIEKVNGKSLLQYMNDDKNSAKLRVALSLMSVSW